MAEQLPTSVSRKNPYMLTASYPDGFSSTILLKDLREDCPCALCKGESILGTHYSLGIKTFQPGMNELESLVPVGNYGIEAHWRDGHDSGIYSWAMLREIFEKRKLSEEKISQYEAELRNS